MKLLSPKQIKLADSYTITHEPISSHALMERASIRFVEQLLQSIPESQEFCILCGTGNNGGDGLAISRLLAKKKKKVHTYIIRVSISESEDFTKNYDLLTSLETPFHPITITEIKEFSPILISKHAVIIDGIFGIGINKPLQGITQEIVSYINTLSNYKVAIDIPSGMYADKPMQETDVVFEANLTLTFQNPKLLFLFPESYKYTGWWQIIDIGLLQEFEHQVESSYYYTHKSKIQLQKRNPFSHKGTFGHALLIAGSYGKMGAAILSTKSCLKSGCGLLTTHVPSHGNLIIQIACPEAMSSIDSDEKIITEFPTEAIYNAIGIGPGIGTDTKTIQAFTKFIKQNKTQLILDADAINILGLHKELIQLLPKNTILTPHPKEFDRLTQEHSNSFLRFTTQQKFSKETGCIVVLKGKYTSISLPNGDVIFNSSGNPGMATAGSGDVLTGIILSFLAQGYSPEDAAKIGVYIHGLSGDLALQNETVETITAQNIIENLSKAFILLQK